MIFLLFSMACWEDSVKTTLPPSRLKAPPDARMVRYGSMRGFLVQKKPIRQGFVWKAGRIDPQLQQCAERQLPENSAALLITGHDTDAAKSYLANVAKGDILIQDFQCSVPSLPAREED